LTIGFVHRGSEEECHAIERWRRSHGLEDLGCPDGRLPSFHGDGFIKRHVLQDRLGIGNRSRKVV